LTLGLVACFLFVGCATRPPAAPSVVTIDAAELLLRGDANARVGQGLRAEQYFEAALEAGAPPSEVYPRLLSVCLAGGRLSAALGHVEDALGHAPRDPHLLELRGALESALDAAAEGP
jgi:hypothetical protein